MEPSESTKDETTNKLNRPISISPLSKKHAIIDNLGNLYLSDPAGENLTRIPFPKKFVDITLSDESVAAITEDGMVYLWGSNIAGIFPNLDQIQIPMEINLKYHYSAKKIVLGETSLAILMTDSTIYFWGFSNGESYHHLLNFSGKDISGIMTEYGDKYAAVSTDGKVYLWTGSESLDEATSTGNSIFENEDISPNQPNIIFLSEPVKKVSIGNNHILALTKSGDLYSWGQNNFSQLGSIWGSQFQEMKSPMRVKLPEPIADISAGIFHSLAISRSGKIYLWGLYTFKIEGAADQQKLGWIDKPTEISTGSPIDYVVGNNDLLITVSHGVVNYSE